MLAGQIDQGSDLGETRSKARDLETWTVPVESAGESAFQSQVNSLAQTLATQSAGDPARGVRQALDLLVSGLGASVAAFYRPSVRRFVPDGIAKTRFMRQEIRPLAEVSKGDRASGPSLPAALDLERLPDQGEALLAGRSRRVIWPQTALRARTRGATGLAQWHLVSPLSHALLLIPCLGPEGLLGVFAVDGGLASQRGTPAILSSATLLGALIASSLERNRLEAELASLRKLRAQSDRLETLGRVATSVAHDFNNVLTAIGGNAELLEMALPEDAKELAEVREISEATTRAADLVEEVLSFGRGREEGARRINLAELVSRLGPITRRVAGNAMDVRVDIRADLPSIEVNPGRFERALLNLASNARDAHPPNRPSAGNLTLSAHRVRVAALHQTGELGSARTRRAQSIPEELAAGEYLCLRVEDDGCGMDLSVQERVFEPFFTTKGEGRGTGLGLATCSEVMREMGGAVTVDSAPGEGTAFDLYFPVTR